MKIEYLFGIDKHTEKVSSKETFLKSLCANIDIEIINGKIKYYNTEYSYTIQENLIENNYLLIDFIIESNTTFDLQNQSTIEFDKFAQKVYTFITKISESCDYIWNDINYQCSQIGYSLIYEIENLFRKIITKIMFANYGKNWDTKPTSKEITEKTKQDKFLKREGGFIYKFDFNDINEHFFKEIPFRNEYGRLLQKLEKKLLEKRQPISYEDIKDYVPKTYWERIVKKHVKKSIDPEKIKKIWETLYKYRNKIAHNNILYSLEDLEGTQKLINELRPQLLLVLSKLDKAKFTDEDYEFSESFIRPKIEMLIELGNFLKIAEIKKQTINDPRFDTIIAELEQVLDNKERYSTTDLKEIGLRNANLLKIILTSTAQ